MVVHFRLDVSNPLSKKLKRATNLSLNVLFSDRTDGRAGEDEKHAVRPEPRGAKPYRGIPHQVQ
jgi:hypothetical protein